MKSFVRWLVVCWALGGCLSSSSYGLSPSPRSDDSTASPTKSTASGLAGGSDPRFTFSVAESTAAPFAEETPFIPVLRPSPSPTPQRDETAPWLALFSDQGEPCHTTICVLKAEFPFQRPIRPPGIHTVDPTYRYGSTQNGNREVHRGVEFVNRAGEPVYAVADGWVEFAGDDDQVSIATKKGFYGNVVVIKHRFAGVIDPVYTLYGHFLKVQVASGQVVHQGQQIGEVGLGGVAAGTHLHFEVRVGKNEYAATRNPELWFPPALPESGALAGRFLDLQGNCVGMPNLVLERLDAAEVAPKRLYFATYEDPTLQCLPPWYESFGLSDLPSGRYQLSFVYAKPEKVVFEIFPAKVTYLNIRLP